MARTAVVGACFLALVAIVASARQEAQPSPLTEHPPAGHPAPPPPITDWPQAAAEDVKSIDAIIAAFYASTAGEPNQPREWDRFRSLFIPQARLIPARVNADGSAGAFVLSPNEFVDANKKYFEKGGFNDREAGRCTEMFGNIAHVWSTFESRRNKSDHIPYVRGINSIQLLKDGDRWWIVTVFWDNERGGSAIPEKYLQTPAP